MAKLDPILHQELRLSIVSFLATIESADSNKLMEVTNASKGNLSIQISKLKAVKYISVKKHLRITILTPHVLLQRMEKKH